MHSAACAVACAVLLAQPLRAQSAQPISIQLSALYAGLSGDAYAGFKSGPGFEGQLRYTHPSGFSFGAGYQRTTHGVEGVSSHATLAGPFFEPRYTFEIKGQESIFPYGSLRVSMLKQSLSNRGINSSASGFTANAGGGVLTRLGSRVNLDLGATFGLTSFSDFALIDPTTGQRIASGETGNGSNFVLRGGLAIGIR